MPTTKLNYFSNYHCWTENFNYSIIYYAYNFLNLLIIIIIIKIINSNSIMIIMCFIVECIFHLFCSVNKRLIKIKYHYYKWFHQNENCRFIEFDIYIYSTTNFNQNHFFPLVFPTVRIIERSLYQRAELWFSHKVK
jgi:hypothetical protein